MLMLQGGAVGLLIGSLLAARVRPRRPVLIANLGLAPYAAPLLLLAVAAPAPAVIASHRDAGQCSGLQGGVKARAGRAAKV
ncbi:hypothetical protein [Micromonospora psammae]|uniref:hypothetical protein n=1 Tax=Micromonospora sp. CPCC 205556 TaxID=3122398 RepID=UPI002FF3C0F8